MYLSGSVLWTIYEYGTSIAIYVVRRTPSQRRLAPLGHYSPLTEETLPCDPNRPVRIIPVLPHLRDALMVELEQHPGRYTTVVSSS